MVCYGYVCHSRTEQKAQNVSQRNAKVGRQLEHDFIVLALTLVLETGQVCLRARQALRRSERTLV